MASPLRTYQPKPGKPFTIGREASCDLILRDPAVSRLHASLDWHSDSGWIYTNHSTTSGTWCGETKVERHELDDGDILQLGVQQLRFVIQNHDLTVLHIAPNTARPPVELPTPGFITVGRGTHPIVIEHPTCPQILAHASLQNDVCVIRWKAPTYTIHRKRCRKTPLQPGEWVYLPWGALQYQKGALSLHPQSHGMSVNVNQLGVVKHKRTLLEKISFHLEPGTLLSVIGLSGQGKSTLLHALASGRAPRQGEIHFNGTPHHQVCAQSSVALLPQEPLLRDFLTVQETLQDAARLRLPADYSKEETQQRIQDLVSLVDLEHRLDTRVGVLSGGERRRLALVAQLMGGPQLLLLDEPLSGLDPVNANKLCTHLRQLAWLGHTIILTTHSYSALEISDQVLVLHQGAQAFWGTRSEAYRFFKSNNAESLLHKIRTKTGQDWSTIYEKSPFRLKPSKEWIPNPPQGYYLQPEAPKKSAFPRFLGLEHKQWIRDKGRLATLILQPLLIGLLLGQVFQPGASLFAAAFALLLCANWFALSLSIRSIVGERSLLADEARCQSAPLSLLLAKSLFPWSVALLQSLVCWLLFAQPLGVAWSFSIPFILATTVVPAVGTGLAASALSRNAGQANALLPMLIIPQVALAGALAPLDQMGPVARTLAEAVWSSHTQKMLQNLFTGNILLPPAFILPVGIALAIFIIDRFILARLRKIP